MTFVERLTLLYLCKMVSLENRQCNAKLCLARECVVCYGFALRIALNEGIELNSVSL